MVKINPFHGQSGAYSSLPSQPATDYNATTTYIPSTNTSSFQAALLQPPRYELHDYNKLTPSASVSTVSNVKQKRNRHVDWTTIWLLLAVWASLIISSVILLWRAHSVTQTKSDGGSAATPAEVAETITLPLPALLVATVLNEALIDRCWRRVVYSALSSRNIPIPNVHLARNLRAANFGWVNFVKRAFQWRLSLRDWRSIISYCLLRWLTAVSLASVHFCVSWDETSKDSLQFEVTKRTWWIFGPVILHGSSIFAVSVVWFIPPWKFFSRRYRNTGLLSKYQPYLDRVQGGSIATYETVADMLDPNCLSKKPLEKAYKPGLQLGTKVKGIWLGLITTFTPPIIAWSIFQFGKPGDVLKNDIHRFLFQLVFLAQNIFFLLAFDFIMWNLSLEGLSKSKSQKPNRNFRHLGSSSGIMLLIKAIKQRRPIRAAIYMWLFWCQACIFRAFTVFWSVGQSILTYDTLEERQSFYDPDFWIGWVVFTFLMVMPLFIAWFFTPFHAPICEQDGWRWAKIAQHALTEPGFYGIRNGQAAWGLDVQPFSAPKKEILL